MMWKVFLLPVVVAASVAVGSPAAAARFDQVQVVSYGDLDLTRPSGRQTLSRRVADAVSRVCGPTVSRPLAELAHQRACARTALEDARAQVARAVDLAYGRQVELAAAR